MLELSDHEYGKFSYRILDLGCSKLLRGLSLARSGATVFGLSALGFCCHPILSPDFGILDFWRKVRINAHSHFLALSQRITTTDEEGKNGQKWPVQLRKPLLYPVELPPHLTPGMGS